MLNDGKKIKSARLSSGARLEFIENLQLLLSASIPLGQVFSSLQSYSKSRSVIKVIENTKRQLDNGSPLWKALYGTGLMSSQALSLVRIGEETGKLNENLALAVRFENKQNSLREHIKSAMLYPVFVIGLTLIVGISIAWFLLPRLKITFDQMNLPLPLITKIVLGFGEFLQKYGFIAVPLFILGIFLGGYFLFVSPNTRHIGYKFMLNIPGLGKLLREVEIAKFGYLMSALLKSGLPITRSFQLMAAAAETAEYKKFYNDMNASFDKGYGFSAVFTEKTNTKLLPRAVQQIIITGERSGSLSDSMERIGTVYEERAEITKKNVESIIEPILLIIVWFGVLTVAVSVILPVYSLIGGLNS